MASNLTAQLQHRRGCDCDRGWRPFEENYRHVRGEILLLKDTLNTMVEQLRSFAAEVTRRARSWHRRPIGRPGGGARVGGTWKDLTDNVNLLAANLTTQVRNIAK
jgi:hypothetical protein